MEFPQIADMHLGGEGGMPRLFQIGDAAAKKLIGLVDRAVEQHIVVGHVEMAVVVDPAGLDLHHRGDEGREEGGFWIEAVEHGAATVADFSPDARPALPPLTALRAAATLRQTSR